MEHGRNFLLVSHGIHVAQVSHHVAGCALSWKAEPPVALVQTAFQAMGKTLQSLYALLAAAARGFPVVTDLDLSACKFVTVSADGLVRVNDMRALRRQLGKLRGFLKSKGRA